MEIQQFAPQPSMPKLMSFQNQTDLFDDDTYHPAIKSTTSGNVAKRVSLRGAVEV